MEGLYVCKYLTLPGHVKCLHYAQYVDLCICAKFYDAYLRVSQTDTDLGPVWQGSGSSKNGSGFGSSGGVASLVELSRFKKRLAK
jgi:hypothetical protein